MEFTKRDQAIEADPFLQLGFGINSFLDILIYLLIMMGVITVISIPLMCIYASHDDLWHYPKYYFNRYSLGNMGGSTAICAHSSYEYDNS